MSEFSQLSTRLIASMLKMEVDKVNGKMEVMQICRTLMPNGKPDYLSVVNYPMIKTLLSEKGQKLMHKVVFLLVKDFCNSLNVVRNMNEEQMIESAGMLLDECDNFRLEDYTMMFQMAKRGELVKIYDRIDMQVITDILDAYWQRRHEEGEKDYVEQIKHFDSIGNTEKLSENINPQDRKMISIAEGIGTYFSGMKDFVTSEIGDREQRKKLAEIEKEDTEKIKQQLKQKGYPDEEL